jgi:transcriptional regulator with XRE-family HTH domain
MVALGMAVRSVRIRRGWTQRTLEYRSGVHQSTISRFERGQAAGLRFEAVGCMLAALRAHEPIRHRVLIWLEAESAADPRVAPP